MRALVGWGEVGSDGWFDVYQLGNDATSGGVLMANGAGENSWKKNKCFGGLERRATATHLTATAGPSTSSGQGLRLR